MPFGAKATRRARRRWARRVALVVGLALLAFLSTGPGAALATASAAPTAPPRQRLAPRVHLASASAEATSLPWTDPILLDQLVRHGHLRSPESGPPSPTTLRPTPPGPPGSWKLVFDNEFNGTSLDHQHWSTCFPWKACTNAGNNELEWYTPENVTEGGGDLQLTARHQEAHGLPYTSGMIQSDGKFVFTYGYAEIRARLPAGQGMWPAFWLLPADRSWPPEIDVVEAYQTPSDEVLLTVHYGAAAHPLADQSSFTGPSFTSGYHTFGVDWEPTGITWYVDGAPVKHSSVVISQPMYLLVNLAINGNQPPSASTELPAGMSIDYVRVWQR